MQSSVATCLHVCCSKGEYMTENWKELVDEKKGSNPWGWKYAQGGAPGYQIAYGIEAETDGPHGYPVDEMVLMDWSGEHLEGDMYGNGQGSDSRRVAPQLTFDVPARHQLLPIFGQQEPFGPPLVHGPFGSPSPTTARAPHAELW